jgi:hypothetical protein
MQDAQSIAHMIVKVGHNFQILSCSVMENFTRAAINCLSMHYGEGNRLQKGHCIRLKPAQIACAIDFPINRL